MGGVNGYSDILTIKYEGVNLSPIPLEVSYLGGQLVLGWTNALFGLQSAPFATGTFTNIPGATSPHTNTITGTQQFFRLISN